MNFLLDVFFLTVSRKPAQSYLLLTTLRCYGTESRLSRWAHLTYIL